MIAIRKTLKKKRWFIPLTIFALLLAARLALPYFVKKYVNQVLNDLPGYKGNIEDVNLALYRGAYEIYGLRLIEYNSEVDVPLLTIPKADVSVQWGALFNGKIVSEIVLSNPSYIYVLENHQQEMNAPQTEDWSKALTDLVPIEINRLKINDGTVAFVQINAVPEIDLHLNNLNLLATNLRNVLRTGDNLPSEIEATAKSTGEGKFHLTGTMDLVKKIPDLDWTFSLQNTQASALNPFTKHYAELDFNKGDFNLFGELAIADAYVKGYFKPILENSTLVGKEDGFLDTLWEGFVGFFKFLLKNKSKNTLATKIPIEGDLNQAKTKVLSTVLNLIKNGWIKAYEGKVDDEIEFLDANKKRTSKTK